MKNELLHGILNLYQPLTAAEVKRFSPVKLIQFVGPVSRSTLARVDEILERHPRAMLRLSLNGCGAFDDLSFLEFLPHLRSLNVDAYEKDALAPIRQHPLRELGVGGNGASLRPLEGHPLEVFYHRDRVHDLDVVGSFRKLRWLSIGGKSPDSLAHLKPLTKLRRIDFQFVAPRRFEELCALPALEVLSIWRAKKLEARALLPINRIGKLKRLILQELPRIRTLSWLKNPSLKILELEDMQIPAAEIKKQRMRVIVR